jgi:hypothetical protein
VADKPLRAIVSMTMTMIKSRGPNPLLLTTPDYALSLFLSKRPGAPKQDRSAT